MSKYNTLNPVVVIKASLSGFYPVHSINENHFMKPAFCYFLLTSSLLYHHASAQNAHFSGHLSGIAGNNYVYLTEYPMGNNPIVRDSARIKSGAFTFNLSIPDGEGTIFYFSSVPMVFGPEGGPADEINF